MKNMRRFLSILLIFGLFLSACGSQPVSTEPSEEPSQEPTQAVHEHVDYAGSLELNMDSDTAKLEVTVKTFVDGDTVHFHVGEDVMADGILKARFLAINTPESTGKIEEYGKAASNFTKEKLTNAASILIESENGSWNPDSTGDRYLVWVWYKPTADEPYRNLNVEILQEGLALANSAAGNRYGETCMAAIAQAKLEKNRLYSGEKDPDFFYGDAVELTLKELRTNIESYNGMKVAFNGVISLNSGSQGVYVETLDPETNQYFGMYVYYGHGLNGTGLDILSVGNEVRIVGTVQYYEAGGTWQVSGLTYRMMQPDDPGNIQKLSEGHRAAFVLTDADTLMNGTFCYEQSDEDVVRFVSAPYAAVALDTTVEMKGLTVTDAYTTENGGSSDGAITLYCDADGVAVTVRTVPMINEAGERITQEIYLGKTIDVKGVIEYYDGGYQIKVFAPTHITITE